jgi:hypothetical protein
VARSPYEFILRRAKEALKKIGEKIYEHRQALALSFQKKALGKYITNIFLPFLLFL